MIRIHFGNWPTMSISPLLPDASASHSDGEKAAISHSFPEEKPRLDGEAADEAGIGAEKKKEFEEMERLPYRRIRKCQEVGQVLRQFNRLVKGEVRLPKLENIRYRVMRSFKKFIRRVLDNRDITAKGLLRIESGFESNSLSQFKAYCLEHSFVLHDFSSLRNGPCVDHRGSGLSTSHNTYNNDYMRQVFKVSEVQTAYQLFVELLFPGDPESSLCRRFNIQCCQSHTHSNKCAEKWEQFKELVFEYMGADVRGFESSQD